MFRCKETVQALNTMTGECNEISLQKLTSEWHKNKDIWQVKDRTGWTSITNIETDKLRPCKFIKIRITKYNPDRLVETYCTGDQLIPLFTGEKRTGFHGVPVQLFQNYTLNALLGLYGRFMDTIQMAMGVTVTNGLILCDNHYQILVILPMLMDKKHSETPIKACKIHTSSGFIDINGINMVADGTC